MSRLVDPGLGEVCDRLTILALKVLYGEQAGRDVSHFLRERSKLLPKVAAHPTTGGSWFEHVLELMAVNAALWQATDQLRAEAADGTVSDWKTIANLGLDILRLNDLRASLVAKINRCAGEPAFAEKLA